MFAEVSQRALLALILGISCVAAGQDTYIANFDWLIATNGKDRFATGLITLNEADLERFVPTGSVIGKYQIGPLLVENRAGIYYSNSEFPDTELDVPASVQISYKDRVLLGGKGYSFDVKLIDNNIMVEHWNGNIGCSLARWYLQYDLNPAVQVVESEYADLLTGERCKYE